MPPALLCALRWGSAAALRGSAAAGGGYGGTAARPAGPGKGVLTQAVHGTSSRIRCPEASCLA